MKRHEALKVISENIGGDALVLSTTGMISRELFLISDRPQNFYLLGSMGLTTPVALGMALAKPQKRVIAIEGDGSILLNLGVIPTVSTLGYNNFLLIVLDNEVYASTGGQPTISSRINLEKISQAVGFKNTKKTETKESLAESLKEFLAVPGPSFILVKVESSQLEGTPRISLNPEEIKERFKKTI